MPAAQKHNVFLYIYSVFSELSRFHTTVYSQTRPSVNCTEFTQEHTSNELTCGGWSTGLGIQWYPSVGDDVSSGCKTIERDLKKERTFCKIT